MKENQLTKALNEILADMHILIGKLHNYHWNVSGMQFHAIHSMTEAFYDYFFAQFDDVAERILQLEAKPISTVKGYLEATTLTEDTQECFSAETVLEQVSADFITLVDKLKQANALADEANDLGTQDMIGGQIAWLEKQLWLIRSTLGK